MSRWSWWIAGLLFSAGGGLLAQASIEVGFELPPHGVSFGEPFVVIVQRSWGPGVEPEAFDDNTLAPLSVQLETVVRSPGSGPPAGGDGERRRYRAHAHVVGEVQLAAVGFRYRQGGRLAVASCTPAPFVVRSVLPEPPGDFEWPGDVRDLVPRRLAWWWLAVFVVLGCSVWWWRRPRPVAVVPPHAGSAPPAHELTLTQLTALALPDQVDAAIAAYYAQLAEILRGHLQRRFAVPALVRTSQELVAAVPRGGEALQHCLCACDHVKFGAVRPAPREHGLAMQSATAFVRATVVAEPAS